MSLWLVLEENLALRELLTLAGGKLIYQPR